MADIFLSYAREDLSKARVLAFALENIGWSVFWDRTHLLAGQDVDEAIEQAIDQAGCMIVAWSEAAKKSHWVRGEATIAQEQHKLVPIMFESVNPPIAFRSLQTDDFINWNGDTDNESFKKLLLSLTRFVKPTVANDDQRKSNKSKPSKPLDKSSPNYIEPEMIVIPAGHFQMGGNHKDEKPIHTVTFSKPFSIAKNLVTFAQYDLFAQANNRPLPKDQSWGRDQRPVIDVSWEDACEYTSWLSKLSGKSFRLPSEAEWEYAARANTSSEYYWGEQGPAEDFAWFNQNSEQKTHPVGEKKPNAFGLYDMSGNVWEWVQDCWHKNYNKAPIDGTSWESEGCTQRVLRGGSWYSNQDTLRSASRFWDYPDFRYDFIGFRLAQD